MDWIGLDGIGLDGIRGDGRGWAWMGLVPIGLEGRALDRIGADWSRLALIGALVEGQRQAELVLVCTVWYKYWGVCCIGGHYAQASQVGLAGAARWQPGAALITSMKHSRARYVGCNSIRTFSTQPIVA